MTASDALRVLPSRVEVLTPTGLEYWAARLLLPGTQVHKVGVGLANCPQLESGSIVVLCGLAGALTPSLRPGTVMIPEVVCGPDGTTVRCDPALTEALLAGARVLSFEPQGGRLLTAPSLVTGAARQQWAAQGFAAADMETALLAGHDLRIASVRVILDTPERSISERWLNPTRALLQPDAWPELVWLGRAAPSYALRAARIVRAGLDRLMVMATAG